MRSFCTLHSEDDTAAAQVEAAVKSVARLSQFLPGLRFHFLFFRLTACNGLESQSFLVHSFFLMFHHVSLLSQKLLWLMQHWLHETLEWSGFAE